MSIFGGMPAVMSTDLPQIAYAGQPRLANWNGPNTPIEYSENYNYIFLNTPKGTSFVSSPLESDASISSFDPQYEGRAPDISPDGTMIVFESNRPNGAANYSIYLYSLKNKLGHAGDRVHSELPARQVLSLRHQADPRRTESDLEHWLGGHLEPAVIRGDGLTLP